MPLAFIFDWSGTLSDNFDNFYQVCQLMFQHFNQPVISRRQVRENVTVPYMRFWHKYLPQLTKRQQDVLYEKFIHQVGNPPLHPHVKAALRYLHRQGYKLFILSADPASKLYPEIKQASLDRLFTKIFAGVYRKDKVVKQLIKNYKLNPPTTFYAGDTLGDIEAGKSAGAKTVAVSWGYQPAYILRQTQPDYLLKDIIALKKII